MSRLEPIPPADLDPAQAPLYAGIVGGPRSRGPQHFELTRSDGALLGPFNAFLLSPQIGGALQELGAAVRYRSQLSPRTREMAILAVAARWDCAFERAAHQSVGRAVGLSAEEMSQVRAGRVPALEDPHKRACAHLTRVMVDGEVDNDTWADWADAAGTTAVFELTSLVGYYSTLALQLRVFRVP